MVKTEATEKRTRAQWSFTISATIALPFAIAFASRNYPGIFVPLFNRNKNHCNCSQEKEEYRGIVEECCCDYGTVNRLNGEVLNPLLQELVKLWCDCPLWPDDGMCHLCDCRVCECPEYEFPEKFKGSASGGLSSDDIICQEGKPEAAVDHPIDTKAFKGWIVVDNPWAYDDETDNGPSAESCPEKRILYKLISGLHSSISIHIAADYLLDKVTNTILIYVYLYIRLISHYFISGVKIFH